MFLTELAEPQLLVIYPGRFQPFHKGHHAVYEWLTGKFGRSNVYIATSNKHNESKSPFTFAEKLYFMQLTGVPADRIVQAVQPYQIKSILDTGHVQVANPKNTVVIFAVSQKDMAEDPRFDFAPKQDGSDPYFQPLRDIGQAENMEKHGYIMTVPTFDFAVGGQPMQSGTELRKMYAASSERERQHIVKDLFGRYTQEAEQILTSKLVPHKPVKPPTLHKKVKLEKVPKLKPEPVAEAEAADYSRVPHTPLNNVEYNVPHYGPKISADKMRIIDMVSKDADKLQQQNPQDLKNGIKEKLSAINDPKLTQITTKFLEKAVAYNKQNPGAVQGIFGFVFAVLARVVLGTTHAFGLTPSQAAMVLETTLPVLASFLFLLIQGHSVTDAIKGGLMSAGANVAGVATANSVASMMEAGGVGVVRGGRDPRYMTATMGNQNAVTGATLGKEMRAFGLTGRKSPGASAQQKKVKSNIGTGIREDLAWVRDRLGESAVDKLAARHIEFLNQDIDEIKQRIATEELPAQYVEKLKEKIAALEKKRLELAFNPQ